MRGGIGTGRWRIGAAGFACLMAASVPAAAASTVEVDGTVLTAWERATTQVTGGDAALQGTEIAFSVSDSSGTRVGTIVPTADLAVDSSPFLAVDQASRTPVVVWSRFDGVSWKIAYARFEGGAWIDVHYLTFGRTDDTLPRLGVSLTGAYLFWVTDDARFMYAPLDLAAGRLFAPPRAITIVMPRWSRGSSLLRRDDSATVNGSSDVPIVIGKGRGDTDDPVLRLAGGETVQGGGDAPVTIPGATKASVWAVGSQDDCGEQVLVIPQWSLRSALVVRFADGWFEVVREIAIPSPVPETFGEDTARLHLESACRQPGSLPE